MTDNLWNPEDHIPLHIKESLSKLSPNYVLAFFNLVQSLKLQKRTGWLNNNISNPESISDHMYRMGIMSAILKTPNVNTDKCVKISLVHDIAESIVGDITPFDVKIDKEEKHYRELSTIKYICNGLIKPYNTTAAQEILDCWLDYEDERSLEGSLVRDLDKFEMLVQCFEYEKSHNKQMDSFYDCVPVIKNQEVIQWTAQLLNERSKYFNI
ncbi:hypothetical protein KAFR_0A04430 [Kazachstania africana CBS 2517]|uniref:5'-deoxynucleotidase n=1 Tax=Kazachstania africana (strain ATCC 22294 / BCRC 22015 / CBS 2517 / CECT 1963 / NBRC 1671 / NRRL Y-8276) TaxID=1071382 RepID=H2ANC8_KAZAF|nr:hypothetical protein KAFR_0A04430 [Kazachstania africana CBS 2517]CCF55878.1 hypothetical protein KAFR_0A04430 [Kazachstania africana CBS 2517]